MAAIATGIGSMPGTDVAEATRVVLGELPDLAHLVELPERGAGASMTGRTLGLVTDLGFDLQPAGWRLTGSSGVDHRRAVSMLRADLDLTEESGAGGRPYKVQVTGPWTLASTVERPRGDRLLADHGARRELAQALAEAVAGHCDDVVRRLAPTRLVVQIDEPALPGVLAGAVPTSSGFGRHRAVDNPTAAEALRWIVDAVGERAQVALHCCAPELPFAVLTSVGLSALSFDVAAVGDTSYDDLGSWLDSGRRLWPGIVPSVDPAGPPPTDAMLTRELSAWWRRIGYDDPETFPDSVVTPTCGLAGASPTWARTALGLCAQVARNLSAEHGRIES